MMMFRSVSPTLVDSPIAETGEKGACESGREGDQPESLRPLKMLVYSHDTFGLGNIRRMMAICEHVRSRISRISVLVLTGSLMLHSFRLIDGIDYVKLPCLRRDIEGEIGVRYLDLNLDSIVQLRRELILSTVTNLRPDIFLVDKKPGGVAGELKEVLKALKTDLPHTKVVLLLRDILDDAATTIDQWKRQCAYKLVQEYYDKKFWWLGCRSYTTCARNISSLRRYGRRCTSADT